MQVYADNAATTRTSKAAIEAAVSHMDSGYGNPSSIYSIGRDAKVALEIARAKVAAAIGAAPEEIYFTGGGTESDNWAIKGAVELGAKKGRHVITSKIEHPAVIECMKYLEKHGCEVTYLDVNEYGQVSTGALREAVRDDTVLVTIMLANNEIGTVLPIKELAAIVNERGVLFHTDAVQAVSHIPVDVRDLGVSMLSLSGHKFGAPRGVGALYVRKGLRLPPILHGGGQERGGRSGTENIAGIAGLAAAIEESARELNANIKKVTAMRDRLIAELLKIPRSRLTGDPVNRLPGIASFVFECIEGESMVLKLSGEGICASSGSACSSGSLDPSHVLLSIGLPHEVAHGSLRLSINELNTDTEIDYILETLPGVVAKLREMSPLW